MDVTLRFVAVAVFGVALTTVLAETSGQQTAPPEVTTGLVVGRTVDAGTDKAVAGAVVTLNLTASQPAIPGAPASPTLPASPSRTGHDHATFQVNIGNLFFKDFVVTFDFRRKVVVFEKP